MMTFFMKNRNFLLLFLGRTTTNIGDSLYYVAAMWLVYELGGSAFYSGLAGFLILLPMTLQFIAGPLVDYWPIKRTLIVTQCLQCLLILIIPTAYYFGFLTVQLILVIVPLAAFIEQFAYPSQTKALPLILNKSDLVKGNAFFSFAYKGIDMIFTASGGVLIAAIGAIALFIVDSITFVLTVLLFCFLKLPKIGEISSKENHQPKKMSIEAYFTDLKEGFSIVFHSLLAVFLLGSVVCNFALGTSIAVLPAFANDRGGADIYGLYLAAEATGVLIGSLIASWAGRFKVGFLTIVGFIVGAACWVLAAFVSPITASILLFGAAWIPIGMTNVLFGSVTQSVVPGHMLGRVSSATYSMSAVIMPVGSFIGGYSAGLLNSSLIFALAGSGLLVISIVWVLHPDLRNLPKTCEMSPSVFHLAFRTVDEVSDAHE
jgi:MFS family permease